MVPNINPRGHSFKGVAAYLMHDRDAKTRERVGWTSTHNLYTDDIEEAARFMAWTDKNRDLLKTMNGNYRRGAEAETGNVYHYSHSWAPDETPTREEMERHGHSSVAALGLSEHQYFFVSHTDEPHPHLHIVINLVHPETGKIANVYRDRKILDRHAHEYEQDHGIKCENRDKKYQAWEQGRNAFSEKERREDYKEKVTTAFERSDSAKGFQAALGLDGLRLARGNRRGFVVVDERGDVYALNRLVQFEGEIKSRDKTKAINERLKSVDVETLPMADTLAAQRKAEFEQKTREREEEKAAAAKEEKREAQPEIWDRDKAALESLKRMEDAAIEKAKAEEAAEREAAKRAAKAQARSEEAGEKTAPPPLYQTIDRDREQMGAANSKRLGEIEDIKASYNLGRHKAKLNEAEQMLAERSGWLSWLLGDKRRAEEHAEKMRLNYENTKMREQDAIAAINRKYGFHEPETQRGGGGTEEARLAKEYDRAAAKTAKTRRSGEFEQTRAAENEGEQKNKDKGKSGKAKDPAQQGERPQGLEWAQNQYDPAAETAKQQDWAALSRQWNPEKDAEKQRDWFEKDKQWDPAQNLDHSKDNDNDLSR